MNAMMEVLLCTSRPFVFTDEDLAKQILTDGKAKK